MHLFVRKTGETSISYFYHDLGPYIPFNSSIVRTAHLCLSAEGEYKENFFQRNPGYLIASLTSLKFSDCCHFYDRITSLQGGRRLKFDWRTRLAEGGYKDCALIPFSTSPFIEQHLYYRRCDLTI